MLSNKHESKNFCIGNDDFIFADSASASLAVGLWMGGDDRRVKYANVGKCCWRHRRRVSCVFRVEVATGLTDGPIVKWAENKVFSGKFSEPAAETRASRIEIPGLSLREAKEHRIRSPR